MERMTLAKGYQVLRQFSRPFLLVVMPLLLSIIPLLYPSREARCGYVILVMALFWMTEVLPLAVTALIPVFAFPLLGIAPTGDVCMAYMKETNMVFVGGFSMAIAVEYSNLHTRIALGIILLIGQSPRMLMMSFMLTTMLLSMLISNIATTAMMISIIEAILSEIYLVHDKEENGNNGLDKRVAPLHQNHIELLPTYYEQQVDRREQVTSATNGVETSKTSPEEQKGSSAAISQKEDYLILREMCFLGTAFSANLGGTGILTGTAPNLVLKSVLASSYTELTGLNFLTWLLFNIPGTLICVLLAFLWLEILYMGLWREKKTIQDASAEHQAAVKRIVESKYKELGPITFQQVEVVILFSVLLLLWLFRQPEFIPGWADWFSDAYGVRVGDATPAILILVLFFILPARLNFWCFRRPGDPEPEAEDDRSCMSWSFLQKKFPWNIMLLLGGGFAIATGANASGLSKMLGKQLRIFRGVDKVWITLTVSFITAMFTEVASNTAVVVVVLPIINELALQVNVNPIYLMLPATVCCSYAFMLPAATPTNAIALTAGGIKTSAMIRAGIVMNIICVLVINVMINTLGYAIFELDTMPAWTNSSVAK